MNKEFHYLLLVLTIIFLTSCSRGKLDLKDVLGTEIDLINKDYEYGDYLTFSGEGYTCLLYSLSDVEMNSIINKISSQELPLEKELFKRRFWIKTPIEQSEDVVSLISSYHSNDKKFLKFQKKLKNRITNSGNYFGYYYKETVGNIYDIELYLLDTKNNKIYIVRHRV